MFFRTVFFTLMILISQNITAKELVATVTTFEQGNKESKIVIPVYSDMTNEEILSKYRPTDKKNEMKGEWSKSGKYYKYSSSNSFHLCAAALGGGIRTCVSRSIVSGENLIKKEGLSQRELVYANEKECRGEESSSIKVDSFDEKFAYFSIQKCKKNKNGKPNRIKIKKMAIKPIIKDYVVKIERNRKIDASLSKVFPEDFLTCEGNPCDVITGNKIETSVDYPHPDFPIVRVYQSKLRYVNTGIGAGWAFNFETKIEKDKNNVFSLIQGGETYKIENQQIKSFPRSLFINKDSEYIVILKDMIYKFNKNGLLKSISDFYEEKANFLYTNNVVSKINLKNGFYTIHRENNKITKITTPDKKEITYHFEDYNVKSGEYEFDSYLLNGFSDINGNNTSYEYTDLLLSGRTNKNGQPFASWEYNDLAQVTESRHGDFDITKIHYQIKGNKELRTVKTPYHTNKYEIKDGVFYKKNDNEIKSKKETTSFKYEYLKEEGYGSNLPTSILNKKTKELTTIEYTNNNQYGYYLEKSISINDNKMVYHYDGLILYKIEVFKGEELSGTILNEFNKQNQIKKLFINDSLIEEYAYHQDGNLKEYKKFEDDSLVEKTIYENYNEFNQPKKVSFNEDVTFYDFNSLGYNTLIENDNVKVEFTLDAEGNQLEIKEYDKATKETQIITQNFDAWNHLKTKLHNDYKEEYFYQPDNNIEQIKVYYKDQIIEDKTFSYEDGNVSSVKSKNEADYFHSQKNKKNGILHKYKMNHVASEVFINSDNKPDYIKVGNKKIFTYEYDKDLTTITTTNKVKYKESKTENRIYFESKEYGEEEYLKTDSVVTINRNGIKEKRYYDGEKIIRIEKEGQPDTIYSYPDKNKLKISKNNDSLTINNNKLYYEQINKFDGKESTFKAEKDKLTYPSGNTVQYIFDENNVLTDISFNDSVVIKDLVFNGGNDYHSFEYGNGIKVSKSFDHLNLLTNEHNGLFEEKVLIEKGRIKNIKYSNEDNVIDYRFMYDKKNQLEKINKIEEKLIEDKKEKTKIEYKRKFDENGNVKTSFFGDKYKYKKNSNQIDSESVDYDISGNMTLIDDMTIVYGDRNEILEVFNKDNQLIAKYSYNLKGERAKAVYPLHDIVKYFYYDNEGKMIEEEINGEFKSFIYLNWQIIGYNYKGQLYFNHYSSENTIKATTDMNGNIEYFDYGFENNTNNSFVMYLGQYKDEVTGLYYNYNRDYSHKLKRYLQIDPLKLYDGSNPYIYVNNNHINYIDTKGLCSCKNVGQKVLKSAYKEHYIKEKKNNINESWRWGKYDKIGFKGMDFFRYGGILNTIRPYIYDSTDHHFSGINKCNIFVDYLYRQNGFEMPSRDSYKVFGANAFYKSNSNISKYFKEIKKSESSAGDLIVKSGDEYSSGHIGLVVDQEKTISASTMGVRFSDHKAYESTVVGSEKPKYYKYINCSCE